MVQIITYTTSDPAAPAHMRAAAAMVPQLKPGKTAKNPDPYVPGTQWVTTAPTEDEARAKLQAVWETERKSIEPRKAPPKKPTTTPAAVGDVI